MSSRGAMPFLTAPLSLLKASNWEIKAFDSDEWALLGDQLEGWDPLRVLELRRAVEIDVAGVRLACRLAADDCLRLAVIVWSQRAAVRKCLFRSGPIESGTARLHLAVSIQGDDIAGEVEIRTELVLAERSRSADAFAPKLPGSRIWSDEHLVEIEGSASQFPVEAADFSSMPWIPAPEAPWHLEIDSSEPHASFLGSVRLFLNSENPVVRDLDQRPLVQSMLNYDVARSLLSAVIGVDEFQSVDEYFERGSLGAVVRDLASALFPGMSLREIAEEMRSRPSDFDTRVRAGASLLNE